MAAAKLWEWTGRLGRLDKAFLAGLAAWVVLHFAAPASGYTFLLAFLLYILGLIVLSASLAGRSGRPSGGCAIA